MSEYVAQPQIAIRDSQLQSLNEKISRLVTSKPWADIYSCFSLCAQLAQDAAVSAEELRSMPGTMPGVLEPVSDFWLQVQKYNCAAALAVAGENRTLADALVTFRLLRTLSGSENAHCGAAVSGTGVSNV